MGGDRWKWLTRDLVLFVGGLAGVLHETVFNSVDRPGLLMIFAGMMGLPVFLAGDRRAGRHSDNDTSSTPSASGQAKKA